MDELIGIIKIFAGNFAPQGWAFCDGQLLSISKYEALFSILGNTYGGVQGSTFALPDLRSRVPIGIGQGTNLSLVSLGEKKGTEGNALSSDNVPALTGIVNLSSITGTASGTVSTSTNATIPVPCSTTGADLSPVNNVMTMDGINSVYAPTPEPGKFMQPLTANLPINFTVSLPVAISSGSMPVIVNQNSGSSPRAFNIVQPVLGLNYIICIEGLFPQRQRRLLIEDTDKILPIKCLKTFRGAAIINKSDNSKIEAEIIHKLNLSKTSHQSIHLTIENGGKYNDAFCACIKGGSINENSFTAIVYRVDGNQGWGQNDLILNWTIQALID